MFADWQRDSKRAAVALFAIQSYRAAVSFERPASDGQSKTSTTPLPRACLINAVKAVEDIRLMLAWDSRSSVGHV
jgi:hypothetical protein